MWAWGFLHQVVGVCGRNSGFMNLSVMFSFACVLVFKLITIKHPIARNCALWYVNPVIR